VNSFLKGLFTGLIAAISCATSLTSVAYAAPIAPIVKTPITKPPQDQTNKRTQQQVVMTETNEAPLAYSTDGTFVTVTTISGKMYVVKGRSLKVNPKTKSYTGTIAYRRLAVMDAESIVLKGKLEAYNQAFSSKLSPDQQFGQKPESANVLNETKFGSLLKSGGLTKATRFDLLEIADWIMDNIVN
jgi:hypothetical protein